MAKYNEELVKAGVMLAGDGLHPTSKGARVRFDGRERTVIDGPFTEAKELIAGYWVWECASRDEAIEWLKRAPFDGGIEIELRQVFEAEDFGRYARAARGQSGCASRPRRLGVAASATHRAIDAVWRIESARLIAGLTRIVRDVAVAEDLAQDALVAALEQWPEEGIPDNPGAWLMATAKRRGIDALRRRVTLERKQELIGRELQILQQLDQPDLVAQVDDVEDDVLRLIFMTCHPVLSRNARVALTLRLLGGLSTPEIARAFLVSEGTVTQRIVRAKRTLAEARVPFEVPGRDELADRLSAVLEVIYLVFNEGYAATAGEHWIRPALCEDALRLGRVLAALMPREPEVHGPARPDGAAGLAAAGAGRAARRARAARRSGPRALGPPARAARPGRAAARRGAQRRAGPVHAAGRDRRLPRAGAQRRGDRLAADRRALRRSGGAHRLAGRRAQPRGRGGDGVRPGGRARAGRRRSPTSPRCAGTTCCPACAATCSSASGGRPRRATSSCARPTCATTTPSASCCCRARSPVAREVRRPA